MKIIGNYFLALIFTCNVIHAQSLKIPQPSTQQTIQQDFGLGQISITYSRPNLKEDRYLVKQNLTELCGAPALMLPQN